MGLFLWPSRAALVLATTRVCLGSAQDLDQMMARTEEQREARLEETIRKHMKMMEDGESGPESTFVGSGDAIPEFLVAPPRSKQIVVKRARSFMQEIIAVLSTAEAKVKIDEARGTAAADFLEAPDEDDESFHEDGPEPDLAGVFLMAVGPVVDKLTRAVVSKYGFEGGFEQAINSVEEAMQRKGNEELKAGLKLLADIFAPANPARVPALHRVAHQFLAMRQSQQDAAVAKAEDLLAKSGDDAHVRASVEEYLMVMRGVMARGKSHIKDSIFRLVLGTRQVEKDEARRLTVEERDRFDMSMDIMMEFLSAEEQVEVERELTTDEPLKGEL